MADEIIKQAQDLLEGPIDFEGQKLADTLSTVLLSISGVIAFITGYIKQDIYLTLWIGLAGALVTFLVVVPPYPFYNRAPLSWVPAGTVNGISVDRITHSQ